SKAYSLF
ncbi:hypothetical protein VTL71DRAFT_7378, partial [Oculimacula yallundae]